MSKEKKSSYTKHSPATETGASTLSRFNSYQAPYTLCLAIEMLGKTPELKCVYGEIDDDILVERIDGKYGCIQIATQNSGRSPFKSTDEKIIKSLRNFAILEATFPAHFSWFAIVSSSGFYSDKNKKANIKFLVAECRKVTGYSDLPDEVRAWIGTNLKTIKNGNSIICDLSEEDLFNLLGKTDPVDGPTLEGMGDYVSQRLLKSVEHQNKRLTANELDTLRQRMVSHFTEAAGITTRSLQEELLPFFNNSQQRLIEELYRKKGFDSVRVDKLLRDELDFILRKKETIEAPFSGTVEQDGANFQVELQTIEKERFRVVKALASVEQDGRILAPPVPRGTILTVDSANVCVNTTPNEPISNFDSVLTKAKTLIDLYDIPSAKLLLDGVKDVVLQRGSPRDKFRWNTNYAAALDTAGETLGAVPYLLAALEYAPTDTKALCNASYAYIIQGDLKQAESYARKAIDNDPKNPAVYAALIASKRTHTSVEALLKEIPLELQNASEVSYSLGCLYKEKNELQAALKCFEIAHSSASKITVRLNIQLGELLLRTVVSDREQIAAGGIPEAQRLKLLQARSFLEDAWAMISATSNEAEREPVLVNLAFIARLLHDREGLNESISRLTSHLNNFKSSDLILKTRGLLYLESGRPKEALQDFCRNQTSNDPEILILALEAAYQVDDRQSYKSTLKRISRISNLEIKIDGLKIWFSHLLSKDKWRSAAKVVRFLRDIAPDSAAHHLATAQLNRMIGDIEATLLALQRTEKILKSKQSLRSVLELADEYAAIGKPAESVRLLCPFADLSTCQFPPFLNSSYSISSSGCSSGS